MYVPKLLDLAFHIPASQIKCDTGTGVHSELHSALKEYPFFFSSLRLDFRFFLLIYIFPPSETLQIKYAFLPETNLSTRATPYSFYYYSKRNAIHILLCNNSMRNQSATLALQSEN